MVVGEIKTSFHGGPACITGRMDSTKREGSIDKFSREGSHVASLLTKAVFFFVDELRIGLGDALRHRGGLSLLMVAIVTAVGYTLALKDATVLNL